MVAEFGSTLSEPGIGRGLVELGLPLHAAKGGDDEQGDAILERRRPEHAPGVGSSGDQQMVSAIGVNFRTLEVGCFLAMP